MLSAHRSQVRWFPPDLSRLHEPPPAFDGISTLSLTFARFTCLFSSPYTHLTVRTALSLTLINTMAFVHSTLGWFGNSTCMAVPAGPHIICTAGCLWAATLLGHASSYSTSSANPASSVPAAPQNFQYGHDRDLTVAHCRVFSSVRSRCLVVCGTDRVHSPRHNA